MSKIPIARVVSAVSELLFKLWFALPNPIQLDENGECAVGAGRFSEPLAF